MALPSLPTTRAISKLVTLAAGLFALLEMSTRVYLFGFAGLVPARINSVHGLPQTGFTQPSRLPGLAFELKPGVAGYFKLVPFSTNSRGLRDREYALGKPANTFRVAVLGASFAFPAGVAIEHAFHSLLEEQLSDEFAPTRYEFINFAVGMYNPKQVLTALELRALDYDPDLILFTATRLSLPRLVDDPSEKPQKPDALSSILATRPVFQKSYPILQSFFLRFLAERTGRGPEIPHLQVGALESLFIALVERFSSPGAPAAQEAAETQKQRPPGRRSALPVHRRGTIIESLAELSRERHIPIVVVHLEFDATEPRPVNLEVERRIRDLGMYYVDTRHAFRGMRASDFWIYELDPHPNRQAHEIFARVIATFLRSNGLLPQ
ncbi:hypothetical protein N9166_00455 [bacterium]|nr:hypothetical protein [bacterium]